MKSSNLKLSDCDLIGGAYPVCTGPNYGFCRPCLIDASGARDAPSRRDFARPLS